MSFLKVIFVRHLKLMIKIFLFSKLLLIEDIIYFKIQKKIIIGLININDIDSIKRNIHSMDFIEKCS